MVVNLLFPGRLQNLVFYYYWLFKATALQPRMDDLESENEENIKYS